MAQLHTMELENLVPVTFVCFLFWISLSLFKEESYLLRVVQFTATRS